MGVRGRVPQYWQAKSLCPARLDHIMNIILTARPAFCEALPLPRASSRLPARPPACSAPGLSTGVCRFRQAWKSIRFVDPGKPKAQIRSSHQAAGCQSSEASPSALGPPSPLRAFNRARRPLQRMLCRIEAQESQGNQKDRQLVGSAAFSGTSETTITPGPPGAYS